MNDKSKPFNPDNFKLEKEDLVLILKAIEDRWKGNFIKNGKYLFAAKAMKAGIMLTSDDVVSKVWSDVLTCVNAMMALNDLTQLSEDTGFTRGRKNVICMRENLLEKIKSGELFDPQ